VLLSVRVSPGQDPLASRPWPVGWRLGEGALVGARHVVGLRGQSFSVRIAGSNAARLRAAVVE